MSEAGDQTIDVKSTPGYPGYESTDQLANIDIVQKQITVSVGEKTLNIYSQQTFPESDATLTVLLLHGMRFTSQNWVDIHTLQLLASWGFRGVAVDLPGYGKSKDVSLGEVSTEEFLSALVGAIGATPVIVSPSMSGSYSLPYLFSDPSASLQRAKAFVPVAPVMTDKFRDSYARNELPTLIVFGVNDVQMGYNSRDDLRLLPRSKIAVLPDSGHPCYLEQPVLFHNVLHVFLSTLPC